MKKICVLIIFFLSIVASTANATTGIEFMQLGATEQREAVEPLILEYVSQGHKNVPSWARLSGKIEELTRKNGWGNEDISTIALEAAKELGME